MLREPRHFQKALDRIILIPGAEFGIGLFICVLWKNILIKITWCKIGKFGRGLCIVSFIEKIESIGITDLRRKT